jgi:hypothetical protein
VSRGETRIVSQNVFCCFLYRFKFDENISIVGLRLIINDDIDRVIFFAIMVSCFAQLYRLLVFPANLQALLTSNNFYTVSFTEHCISIFVLKSKDGTFT